jgi:serine/threonine protein kinase
MRGGEELECTFNMSAIKNKSVLGKGAYGKAIQAEKLDETKTGFFKRLLFRINGTNSDSSPEYYVVKDLLRNATETDIDDAIKEAKILKHLADNGLHPNILHYKGCSYYEDSWFGRTRNPVKTDKSKISIVTEFNPGYIDLMSFIDPKRQKPGFMSKFSNLISAVYNRSSAKPIEPRIGEGFMQNCLTQLYDGLAEIHKRGVAHRDIKPENILIHPTTGNIKYIDFGLSKILTEPGYRGIQGSPFYVPPILFSEIGDNYDRKGYEINDFKVTNESFNNLLKHGDYFALAITIFKLKLDIPTRHIDFDNIMKFYYKYIDIYLKEYDQTTMTYEDAIVLDSKLNNELLNEDVFTSFLTQIDEQLTRFTITPRITTILSGYKKSSTEYPDMFPPIVETKSTITESGVVSWQPKPTESSTSP